MTESRGSSVVVPWKPVARALPEPVVRRVPYVELKLEHPGVEATCVDDAFFPDAMPYRTESERRVFYWRSVLPTNGSASSRWGLVCATTHGVRGIPDGELVAPELWTTVDDGHEVVVDGTVAGGSTTVPLREYDPPRVTVSSAKGDAVSVDAGSRTTSVAPGTNRTVTLPSQMSRTAGEDTNAVSVTPELRVRYAGERTFYHPAPGAGYALFPSFGLDLDALDRRVPVPTTHGELDHDALADALGVDLAERPYPERVLWQAFAYSAFDPHRNDDLRLAKLDGGLLAVENPAGTR